MTQRLFSVGFIASTMRTPVPAVQHAAKQAGVEPAYELNGLAYYDHDGHDAIVKVLNASTEWFELDRAGNPTEAANNG
jgi:hypothetical protein